MESRALISVEWTSEFSQYSLESQQGRALCTVKAPEFIPKDVSLDIVAVIDKSSSMGNGKMTLVKKTLKYIIGKLQERDGDRLSIITYGDDVEVKFHLTKVDNIKAEADDKYDVMKIQQDGYTNLCGGLLTGMYEIINRTRVKGDVATVLLFTDGIANVGVKEKDDILEEMRKAIDPPGVHTPFEGSIYTFGFGSDHDDRLLESISTLGGGMYYYIDSENKIPESFGHCLGGVLSTMSKENIVKFRACEGNVVTHVHTVREPIWKDKMKECEIVIGDLQSENKRDIMVEFKLPKVTEPVSNKVISCELTYTSVSMMSPMKCNVESSLMVERKASPMSDQNTKVDMQNNRILVAEALKKARHQADTGDYTEAKATVQAIKLYVSKSISHEEKYCQQLMKDLTKTLDAMEVSGGRQYMMSKMQSHASQRSNYPSESSFYDSSLQSECANEAKESVLS